MTMPTPPPDTRAAGQAGHISDHNTISDALTGLQNAVGQLQAVSPNAGVSGDLSGSLPSPTVAKVNGVAVTGTPSAGQVLTATSGIAATWQPSSAGVALDGTATDIQPLGTQAAGAKGKASDAGHVHQMPTLDQVSPPVAAVGMNSQKITGLAFGAASNDAAAFGQIPGALPPTGTASGDLAGTYPAPSVARLNGVAVTGTPAAGQVLTATSGTAAAWKGALIPWFNVRSYGATGNGTTNDLPACQAAVNACVAAGGGIVYFPAGSYAFPAALIVDGNNVTLLGDGYGFATAITYLPGTARTAAIIIGNTHIVTCCSVVGLSVISGNGTLYQAGSGHGIVFRSSNSLIKDVIVQFAEGDNFHLAMDALTPAPVFDVVMIHCYAQCASANNLYIDSNFENCEYINVKFQGGSNLTPQSGTYGLNCNGSEQKFEQCHAYFNMSGGAVFGLGAAVEPTDISIMGGEWETNVGIGVNVIAAARFKCVGADFYNNSGGSELQFTGSDMLVTGCQFIGQTAGEAINVNFADNVVIANNIIDCATSYNNGIYVVGNYVQVRNNYINSDNTGGGSSVGIGGGALYTEVSGNWVSNGIYEGFGSGADYSRIYNNVLGAGTVGIGVFGAHSVYYLNSGPGAASSTSGVVQSAPAATSAVTVTAAAITSVSSLTVPATEVQHAGVKYRVSAHGTIGTAASAPTATVDLRWGGTGGTVIASLLTGTSAAALAASMSGRPVLIEAEIEFVTATTVVGWLKMTWQPTATATAVVALASITTPVTVFNVAAEVLSLDWTWSAAAAGTTVTIASSGWEHVYS